MIYTYRCLSQGTASITVTTHWQWTRPRLQCVISCRHWSITQAAGCAAVVLVCYNKKALIITRKHQYSPVVIVQNVNIMSLAETAEGNNNIINIWNIIIFTNNVIYIIRFRRWCHHVVNRLNASPFVCICQDSYLSAFSNNLVASWISRHIVYEIGAA